MARPPRVSAYLELELVDLPENLGPGRWQPSMAQSLHLAAAGYEGLYLGIDALGDRLVDPARHRVWNFLVEQPIAFAAVHWGRALPVPLGLWAHEEYHRAALAAGGLASRNGNWLANGWEETVYGVADADLGALQERDPASLARAYAAGVELEVELTREVTTVDFFRRRPIPRSLLLLDNALVVARAFALAGSSEADKEKARILAGESAEPLERDFAGDDLTAWARVLYRPRQPYDARPEHPTGRGLARAVGFSDLPPDAQGYLRMQRSLALLNLANPAAAYIPRFRFGRSAFATVFLQHYPAPFGHEIDAVVLVDAEPVRLVVCSRGQFTRERFFPGLDLQLRELPVGPGRGVWLSPRVGLWLQPEALSFRSRTPRPGGLLELVTGTPIAGDLHVQAEARFHTAGFVAGIAGLDPGGSVALGLRYERRVED